jgi:hypothetical protein
MGFHRLAVPVYFGGLPAGYDYINNAISGTPANADNAKIGGPNAGTYFIAFGEDATSSDANRPNLALAQNTDFIDNILHNDLAVNTRTADVTPGAPVASITITGPGIFIGGVGDTLPDLFHITDNNDDDIDVSGTQVIVASITGGTLGGGFSTGNITLTLNISIPSSQTYRVWYGSRSNLANLPADAFTTLRIGSAVQVDEQVEELFRLLHGNGEAWNAAWDNTIYGLDQARLGFQTILANLHGNSEAFNAAWDATIYDLNADRRTHPAVNWKIGASTAPNNLKRGAYSTIDAVWYAVGDGGTDMFGDSVDSGNTWQNLSSGLGGHNLGLCDVAINPANGVIVLMANVNGADSKGTYTGARTGWNNYTFSYNSGVLSHNVSDGRLCFDATAGKFIAVYRSGSAGMFVDTSSNGIAWTNQTVPSGWSGYTSTHSLPVINAIPGFAIAVFFDEGSNLIHIMTSTNGGVTWADTTVAGGLTASTTFPTNVVHDPVSGAWYVGVYDTTTGTSTIYTSATGLAPWIQVGSPGKSFVIHDIACLPGCLVMVTSNQQILLTFGSPPSTYVVAANKQTNLTPLYMREGGGGLMIWNSADRLAWPSSRVGNDPNEWLATP